MFNLFPPKPPRLVSVEVVSIVPVSQELNDTDVEIEEARRECGLQEGETQLQVIK